MVTAVVFELEILKVENYNIQTMWAEKWGTDEAYSCNKLLNFHDRNRISDLSKSESFLTRRIDCHRNMEVPYDLESLKNNYYIECHCCRPYNEHKEYLQTLFNNIPKFI